MTALALRDRMHRFGWFRALLACAVALLAAAVMLHHGWMGTMDHAAGSGTTPHAHAGHSTPTDASLHTAHEPVGHGGTPGAELDHPGTPGESHAMAMAMCLAILSSGLLLPVVAFVRRLASRRKVGARRKPSRALRPPSAVLPSIWIPPPRGGPSAQSLLCVMRR